MAQTESEPYVLAARFTDEKPSGKAYSQAERLVFQTAGDLSVYRYCRHSARRKPRQSITRGALQQRACRAA